VVETEIELADDTPRIHEWGDYMQYCGWCGERVAESTVRVSKYDNRTLC
jgi:hypothetical protein